MAFDAVWHSAAEVNWALSYEELRLCNVVGTWQIVQLCAERGAPLFFISTISVAEQSESSFKSPEVLSNGYVLSKLAAERYVHRAFACGVAGVIFRPGMLWAHSSTGLPVWPNFFPTRFLTACARLRCAPSAPFKCDITPVDHAAQVMVKLALAVHGARGESPPPWRVFHVFNPKSPSSLATKMSVDSAERVR